MALATLSTPVGNGKNGRCVIAQPIGSIFAFPIFIFEFFLGQPKRAKTRHVFRPVTLSLSFFIYCSLLLTFDPIGPVFSSRFDGNHSVQCPFIR